jgi:hypothetical protein
MEFSEASVLRLLAAVFVLRALIAFGLSYQATAQHNPNSQPSTSGYAVSGSGESIHTSATRKPVLWAVVRRNGTLARGKGMLDANLVEPPGGYEVLFDQNVRKCVYTATIGLSGFESVEDPARLPWLVAAMRPTASLS